jgi:hypothetical protein
VIGRVVDVDLHRAEERLEHGLGRVEVLLELPLRDVGLLVGSGVISSSASFCRAACRSAVVTVERNLALAWFQAMLPGWVTPNCMSSPPWSVPM